MSEQIPGYEMHHDARNGVTLVVSGSWTEGNLPGGFSTIESELLLSTTVQLTIEGSQVGRWDSALVAFLLQCRMACDSREIRFQSLNMPAGIDRLLTLATAVKPHQPSPDKTASLLASVNPLNLIKKGRDSEVSMA